VEEHAVAPRGEYAKIDVRLAQETIAALQSGVGSERARAIKAIETAPQKYAPPVFYVLAGVLFTEGRKDDAGFWFYAGQLRARFDANRCADVSARQAVAVLTDEFGSPINQYMFEDFAKVEALIPKVVDWDRKTAHDYDQRWINLHGMDAMLASLDPAGKPKPLSLPQEEWDAIAEKTRSEYVEGVRQAGIMVKERAAATAARASVRAKPRWEQQLLGSWKMELSSLLTQVPKGTSGAEAAARRTRLERARVEWTIRPDTIAIVNPLVEATRNTPPYRYRIVEVKGNIARLQLTPGDGPADEWDLEYLDPNLIGVLHGSQEVYRLRRVSLSLSTKSLPNP
jgi:hypothetical protein